MFKKNTITIFSIISIIFSSLALIASILALFLLHDNNLSFNFIFEIVSWILLLWSSILGYKLCTSYNLYDDEYKKIGIRIYLIIILFFLYFLVGIMIGIILSTILLSTIWGLKKNYDDWNSSSN